MSAEEDFFCHGEEDLEGVAMTPKPRGLFGGKKVSNGVRAAPLPLASASLDDYEVPQNDELEPEPTGCYGRLQQKKWWSTVVELIGTFAGLGTTFSFVPQAYQTIRTDDVDGLSLGMYIMFVSGVFLWLTYGVLKKASSPLPPPTALRPLMPRAPLTVVGPRAAPQAWPLVVSNVVTFLLSGLILTIILQHLFRPPPPPGQVPVAVCLAGAAGTFAHPRVQAGLAGSLLQPGWHLFAALEAEGDARAEAESALASLSATGASVSGVSFYRAGGGDGSNSGGGGSGGGAVGFGGDWRSTINCSTAQTGRRSDESVVPLAYGVERCIDLIEDAEQSLNMTFAFVVRARPDLLWDDPLPRTDLWFNARVLASSAGNDKLAIVPRAALRSYFGAYSLLAAPGCPMLQPSAREQLPASAHCWMREHALRDCLFRVRPALDGIETGKYYKSGEHVWVPNIASQCHADGTPRAASTSASAQPQAPAPANGLRQQRRLSMTAAATAATAATTSTAAAESAPQDEEEGEALPLAERVAMLEQSLASLVASGAASSASAASPPPPLPSPKALPAQHESIATMLSDAITYYDDYSQPVECV